MSKPKQPKNNKNINISAEIKETSKFDWKPYLVLTVFAFILYGNTLKNDYALDDAIVITQNQFTQKGFSGIPDIFKYDTFVGFWLTSNKDKTADQIQEEKKLVAGGRYRPLSLVTFAFEVEFFGKNIKDANGNVIYKGNPGISHFINILLYLLTTCLLLKIFFRIFPTDNKKKWYYSLPFIICLLFIAHPIHTEAVANVKGRDEIMTLLGSLGAMWFTIKYIDTNKKINLLYSGICLFLGLLSKENAITFLAVIPITIYYIKFKKNPKSLLILNPIKTFSFIDKKKFKKVAISMIPLLIASGIFLIIRAKVLGIGTNDQQIANEIMNNPFLNATTGDKFATIFYTLWLYIKLLFFPHPLTYDYYPNQIEIISWTNPAAFLPLLLYLTMGLYAVYGMIKKRDVVSYSIWFYLIPLSVVSNIFFPVGTFMNERFVFISSIGFCIFIGWLIYKYIPKILKNEQTANYFTGVILFVILSLYSVKTISRNTAWKDDLTLFTTDVKVSSNSAKSNCSAGGKLLEEAQKPENKINKKKHDELCQQSIKYLERSVEIYPEYVDALNLLGNAYFEYDYNISKSLHYYSEVLKLYPYHTIAYGNARIVILNTIGLLNNNSLTSSSYEGIIEACNELLAIQPQLGEAYYLKGIIYGKYLGNLNESILNFEEAVKYMPDKDKTAEFYKDIGVAYGLSSMYDNALKYLLKAVELDPNDSRTYMNIGVTYQQLGEIEKGNAYIIKGNELMQKQ